MDPSLSQERSPGRSRLRRAARAAGALLLCAVSAGATSYKQPGFSEAVALSGLTNPSVVRFLPDGRVLVAEKSGLIKIFPNITTNTYSVVADLRTQVHNFWDRGLLGMAVDPDFATNNYVYVLYSYDAAIGATPPRWGLPGQTSDGCPTPPGATNDGCVISSRLSRLTALGADWTGSETPLINDWCQQYPSHSTGALDFGLDGYLYVSGGDGASFTNSDWGQYGGGAGSPTLANPCGDPPFPVGTPQTKPTAEGGALRSQSPRRTAGEPRVLNGSVLRLDKLTGLAAAGNPLIGSGNVNEQRIIGYGFRNPFRMIVKPGTNEVWVADVGWNDWEELNKIPDVTTARNYGWPCWEGNASQYTGLNICPTQPQTTAPVLTYNHSASTVPGDGCTVGSSSIAGMAFYQGASNYPSTYPNALFFSDYSRKCLWVMFPDGSGNPNPASTAAFASAANGPVDLQIGPDGNLYYVDFDGGRIMKVKYGLAAVATANPTSGGAPLTVDFDGSGSVPAQAGDTLSYAWDLDGDGQFDDSTAQKPTFIYTAGGTYAALLKVTDQRGGSAVSAPITITAGAGAPNVFIDAPLPTLTWKVNDTIAFSGHATDDQGVPIPASNLSWSILIQHCPSNCHTHVYQTFDGVAGASFPAPDHEYPSYLEIRLTATDGQGLQATASVSIQPQTLNLSFQTIPSGLNLQVGTTTSAAPFVRTVILNSANELIATSPQSGWQFSSWSDGGAQDHVVTATAPATYTATFTSVNGLPAPWADQDIGAVGVPGNATYSGGTFTVKGSGTDIEETSDQFHYVYQPLTGDGTIVARVVGIQNTSPWAKGGVMIRETLAGNSAHAMLVQTPSNGIAFQRRRVTGSGSFHTGGPQVAAPNWVRLVRSGNTFTAHSSPDGSTWTLVGTDTIPMAANVLVGLALSSGNNPVLNTTTIDNVTVTSGAAPTPTPTATATATATATPTRTSTPTFTPTATRTATPTFTATRTFTPTPTRTGTATPTATLTPSITPTPTSTPSVTPSFTASPTRTGTATPSPTLTPSITPTATSTPTLTATSTATSTATPNATFTPTGTATATSTATPTATNAPTSTRTPTAVASSTPTLTATATSTPTRTPTAVSTLTPTATVTPTRTNTATLTPSRTPTATATPTRTNTATSTATRTNTPAGPTSTFTPTLTPTPGGTVLPATWTDQDIGPVGVPGSATYSGGVFTVKGSGSDIEETADQFHYAYQALTGDGTIVARVTAIQNTSSWAKGGVMIRESLAPDSAHAMVVLTPGNGIAFQRRRTTAGGSFHTGGPQVAAPYWVRLVRSGNLFSAYSSPDGSTWTLVGTDTIAMASNVYVGLALSSGNNPVLNTTTIDNVIVPPSVRVTNPAAGATFAAPATVVINAAAASPAAPITRVDFYNGPVLLGSSTSAPYSFNWTNVPQGSYTLTAQATDGTSTFVSAPVGITVGAVGLPSPWIEQDIGSPGVAGSAAFASGVFTVKGSGTDIWDLSDKFHYVYQPIAGNATITARVTGVQNTDPWAKAGVMVRESLAASSTHAMMVLTPGNGLAFQYRAATGAGSTHVSGGAGTVPYWVRVVRAGNTLTASRSTDATTWTVVGSATIPMSASAYVGIAVTSHNNGVLCTTTLDSVTVTTP